MLELSTQLSIHLFFCRGFQRFAIELEGDYLQSVAKVKNAKKMNALPWSWKVRLGAVQFQWLIYCINWCCLMLFVKLKCSTPNQKVEHYDGLKLLQHEKQHISRVLTKCGKRWLITKLNVCRLLKKRWLGAKARSNGPIKSNGRLRTKMRVQVNKWNQYCKKNAFGHPNDLHVFFLILFDSIRGVKLSALLDVFNLAR